MSPKPSPTNAPEPITLTEMLGVIDRPAILLNLDYEIVGANQQYCEAYGVAHSIKGEHCYAISHRYSVPCDQAGEDCPLKASVASGEARRVLHLHHTPHGEVHVDVETRPVRDSHGNIRYVVEIMKKSEVASAAPGARELVGRSPAFNEMLALVERVAPTRTNVLLLGETGTGKELVAHAIHAGSDRRSAPFVPVECSGLSETLFESELFGHEKGAFTGAHTRKPGLVESARGGTLFLDEVGDIPLAMQIKLLRLLETGTYRRVGSVEPQAADFRLICATHRDLKQMVEAGEFREDLYYRISSFPIHLPALRERQEDIPLLVAALQLRIAPARKVTVDASAMRCLEAYAFPGNIRELRNILERALIMTDGKVISAEHLPPECRCAAAGMADEPVSGTTILSLAEAEQAYLRRVVAQFEGDKRELARRLGVSERTLYRKLQELDPGRSD